jgi:hypothetical protein
MSDQRQQVGRSAMRVEGAWWVAYYALPDTMEGAIEMGRVRMSIVQDRARKSAFMAIFSSALAEFMAEQFGVVPYMNAPVAAPEHERAGRA